MPRRSIVGSLAMGVALLMVTSSVVAVGVGSAGVAHNGSGSIPVSALAGRETATASNDTASNAGSSADRTPAYCASLETSSTDPAWGLTIQRVRAVGAAAVDAGLSADQLHPPYIGSIPDQMLDGVFTPGDLLTAECSQPGSVPVLPAGVAYDGVVNATGTPRSLPLDSNSLEGILTVDSSSNFYPSSGTPTQWGAQLNAILTNVTIFGRNGYTFWVQNVASYNTLNDTLSFVDNTWNFTNGLDSMNASSLVDWSPDGSDYTGVWVAYSPYIYCPPPFTVDVYLNSSVDPAGDQVLWYNYSVHTDGHTYADGSYDYLVFLSQNPARRASLRPAQFQANEYQTAVVNEGYEFDAFVGADDGANNLILSANATEQLDYCSMPPLNDCAPGSFSYSSVPAAVDYGSQTGEQTVGVAVNYVANTAYLSGGPLIPRPLWGYGNQIGAAAGYTTVVNEITSTGAPVPSGQPYFFVFFENQGLATEENSWAPDVPLWHLAPGTYHYEVMLSDYTQQNGTLNVGSNMTVLRVTLPYNPATGVYTPLWAFGNGELAGISSGGSGQSSNQYILFNNPTTGSYGYPANQLDGIFWSQDDYGFATFASILIEGTSAFVHVLSPPSMGFVEKVPFSGEVCGLKPIEFMVTLDYWLPIEFFETSHLTLSNASGIHGWPSWTELAFYALVPPSQNPVPQAAVYVWDSTDDLVMGNTFAPYPPEYPCAQVTSDALVLYGGSDNVVWGNTFTEVNDADLPSNYFAGIGEAESGDLIYNNNFSVDNPVVYLPYNFPNVVDCLPLSLGGCANNAKGNSWYYNLVTDTWNVTPQPTSDVANTINGFALRGNVLGPYYPTQGGNYYWNYGMSPNNYSSLPYVARFLYTDWSLIYPLGCGSIQAPGAPCGTPPPTVASYQDGIPSGGDFAPLLLAFTFVESGLPTGTSWGVTLGGSTVHSINPSITFSDLETGQYGFEVDAPTGYSVSQSGGTINLTGPEPPKELHFSPGGAPTYRVAFTESGLPSGTSWSVTLGGATNSSTSNTITFAEITGTYGYAITNVPGWHQTTFPYAGTIAVNGTSVMEPILAFHQEEYTVPFDEHGIPLGTAWTVTLNGVAQSSTTATITLTEPNGTYAYTIGDVAGWHITTGSYSGSVTVSGGSEAVAVVFSQVLYTVTFSETGLMGEAWSVTFNGSTESSVSTSIAFESPNGTYSYAVGTVPGYTPSPGSGPMTVSGTNVNQGLTFSPNSSSSSSGVLGLPGNEGYILLGGAAAACVVAAAVAVWLFRRVRP